MNTWHEDYTQSLGIGECAPPNTVVALLKKPTEAPPYYYNADRWILWGALSVGVGSLCLFFWWLVS